jgi:hypothetical protein
MNNILLSIIVIFCFITITYQSIGPNIPSCNDNHNFNECKEFGSCAWCFSSEKCCNFYVCDNTTDCHCSPNKTIILTNQSCDTSKKNLIIILSIASGIIFIVLLGCICYFSSEIINKFRECCWYVRVYRTNYNNI